MGNNARIKRWLALRGKVLSNSKCSAVLPCSRPKLSITQKMVVTRWRKQACRGILSYIHPSPPVYFLRGQDDILGTLPGNFPTIVSASCRFLGCRWALRETLKQISMLINCWHVWTFLSMPVQAQPPATTTPFCTQFPRNVHPLLSLKCDRFVY